jgi:hypothetical protein
MREAEKVRAAVARLGRTRRSERIPTGLRSRVTKVIGEQREAGATWTSIAEAVGLSVNTVKRWGGERGPRRRRVDRVLVPVRIREQPAGERRTGLTLVTAGGLRVEGLGVTEAAELLRELGA